VDNEQGDHGAVADLFDGAAVEDVAERVMVGPLDGGAFQKQASTANYPRTAAGERRNTASRAT
jgi:hypothetical protein